MRQLGLPGPAALDEFVAGVVEAPPDPLRRTPSCALLGEAWRTRGLRAGDLVVLCLPNSAELLHHFFGVLQAGGVPALVPPSTPASRLREVSDRLGARAIAARRLPSGDAFAELPQETIGGMQVAILTASAAPAGSPGEIVLLTSGTCGVASGCVFDLEAVLVNAWRHAEAIGQREHDVVLVSLPLYFSFALVAQALAALALGSRLVVGGPPFGIAAYRRALTDHAVTISSLTPVLVRSILRVDASILAMPRVLTIGGDALEPKRVADVLAARRGAELYLTYGLTQAGPRVSTLAVHAEPAARFASVGRPLPGTTVSLAPAPDGRQQLYVTSDTVMKRSIGDVEGRPPEPPGPRTIATGDAFDQDDDGYLYFRGRLGEFISRDGEKINLAAVRRLASQLPHVVGARTFVVGRADGTEDFDLELRVGARASAEPYDARGMLRRVLQQSEMPRKIRIEGVGRTEGLSYK